MSRTRSPALINACRCAIGGLFSLFIAFGSVVAQAYSPVYHEHSQLIVNRGKQAFMLCNGLFVSGRTVEQIYAEELKLGLMPILPLENVSIDIELKSVTVGTGDHRTSASGEATFTGLNGAGVGDPEVPVMRAVYREGLGCMTLSPAQTLDDIDELPELTMAPLPGDPNQIPWPDGDLLPDKPFPSYVDRGALDAAGNWAFDRVSHGGHESQITLSLIVVHKGDILYERYGPGVEMTTRTRTWSTAKSIASTLIGIATDKGILELDEPLPWAMWKPERQDPDLADPRREITLRHALNMSSGLYPVDDYARLSDLV